MIKAIAICEGEHHYTYEFVNYGQAADFARGFQQGADAYGAGGAGVYTRRDLENLSPDHEQNIIDLINEHIPEAT